MGNAPAVMLDGVTRFDPVTTPSEAERWTSVEGIGRMIGSKDQKASLTSRPHPYWDPQDHLELVLPPVPTLPLLLPRPTRQLGVVQVFRRYAMS